MRIHNTLHASIDTYIYRERERAKRTRARAKTPRRSHYVKGINAPSDHEPVAQAELRGALPIKKREGRWGRG